MARPKKDSAKEIAVVEAAAIAEAEERINANTNYDQMMKEKQELIAEAYRLTGRFEAFNAISQFADVGGLVTLKKIRESKAYKSVKGAETWEKYCKLIGLSRSKVDEDLQNLELFGEAFSTTVGGFGLGYRELRQLKAHSKAGALEVKENSVIIEGEVVSLTDTDKLRDALEQLIDAKDEQIKLLNDNNKLLTDSVNSKEKLIADSNERLEKAYTTNDKLKSKLDSFRSVELEGIDNEDLPAVNMMQECQVQFNKIFLNLKKQSTLPSSDFVQQMLYALICHIICQTDDIRLSLNSNSKRNFEEVRIDEQLMGQLEEDADTPIDIIKRKREEMNEREKRSKKR